MIDLSEEYRKAGIGDKYDRLKTYYEDDWNRLHGRHKPEIDAVIGEREDYVSKRLLVFVDMAKSRKGVRV